MKSGSVRAGGHLRMTLPAGFYTLRYVSCSAALRAREIRGAAPSTRLTCTGVTFTNRPWMSPHRRYSFGSAEMSLRLGWKKSRQ
jgi:hypothetical protein